MQIGRLLTFGVLSTVLAFAPHASAAVTAYNTVVQSGNQAYTGSLGLDFNVLSDPIEILSLGVFDANGDGIQSASVSVAIYERTSQNLVSPVLSFSGLMGTLIGGSRFQSLLVPLTLGPGQYSVVAWGYGPNELNGNAGCVSNNGGTCVGANPFIGSTTDTGAGLVSFVGSARYSPLTGSYPTIIDAGPANRYLAGTFAYQAVPEPATMGLMGVSFAVLGLIARRRRA